MDERAEMDEDARSLLAFIDEWASGLDWWTGTHLSRTCSAQPRMACMGACARKKTRLDRYLITRRQALSAEIDLPVLSVLGCWH